MGLLKHLLGWPVTGPVALVNFSLETLRDTAIREVTDRSAVKRDLMELQRELEAGEIDEAEYRERETELMRRLREVREWRRRLGMGTRGGPVEFGRSAGEGDEYSVEIQTDLD